MEASGSFAELVVQQNARLDIGTALIASGTFTLNQWYERDADAKMNRSSLVMAYLMNCSLPMMPSLVIPSRCAEAITAATFL